MRNAITIDVEDWYHVCGCGADPGLVRRPDEVLPNVVKLLALLAEYDVRATFFVLGSVAEQEPSLVPLISAGGHEVASHGYSHQPVSQLNAEEFRDELRRTAEILERQGGKRPTGFRAPQWSLRRDCAWAFEILCEEGYRYDSSLKTPCHLWAIGPVPVSRSESGPEMVISWKSLPWSPLPPSAPSPPEGGGGSGSFPDG